MATMSLIAMLGLGLLAVIVIAVVVAIISRR